MFFDVEFTEDIADVDGELFCISVEAPSWDKALEIAMKESKSLQMELLSVSRSS